MSNYRLGYFDVLYLDRPLTSKQSRRLRRKELRDERRRLIEESAR